MSIMADSKLLSISQLHVVDGLIVPLAIRQEMVDKMKTMEHYPDDVWIVSYPKSGTTWTSQIVRLTRNNGVQDDTNIDTAVSSANFRTPPETLPRPRTMRNHFPYDKFPCGPPHSLPSKFIYVMRNPKDAIVSLVHHIRLAFIKDLEWDRAFSLFMSGIAPYGDHFDHILSWWSHRDSPNILFLRYEDMKKDLPQAVSKIASFLEVDLASDVVNKIADLTTFEHMKTDNTANKSWRKEHNDEEGKPAFLRKGVVGDWKNYFSAEQSAAMDHRCEEKLKGTGIKFEYE